jgi:hypothetical protein
LGHNCADAPVEGKLFAKSCEKPIHCAAKDRLNARIPLKMNCLPMMGILIFSAIGPWWYAFPESRIRSLVRQMRLVLGFADGVL